jgi:hypothetical protein
MCGADRADHPGQADSIVRGAATSLSGDEPPADGLAPEHGANCRCGVRHGTSCPRTCRSDDRASRGINVITAAP